MKHSKKEISPQRIVLNIPIPGAEAEEYNGGVNIILGASQHDMANCPPILSLDFIQYAEQFLNEVNIDEMEKAVLSKFYKQQIIERIEVTQVPVLPDYSAIAASMEDS
jgi:hypothetical protein